MSTFTTRKWLIVACLAIAGEVTPVPALVAPEICRAELNCQTCGHSLKLIDSILHVALVPAVRVEALSTAAPGARQGERHPDLPEAQWEHFVRTLAAFKNMT